MVLSLQYLLQVHTDHGFALSSSQHNNFQSDICCFSTKNPGVRTKTGWLGISITCQSGATCLPTTCYNSQVAL
jgi:hypothetical protein